MSKKIFSFDAETNGLWGQAFAIAAVVVNTDNGKETATFSARCPIAGDVNPWVAENVLLQMQGIPETHTNYKDMLIAFVDFYIQHKDDADIIVHMGVPVEAKLFIDAHEMGILGDWDAPYPLIDISALPKIGTSVDDYNRKHELVIPAVEGGTHNPLYDSRAAAKAYLLQEYGKRFPHDGVCPICGGTLKPKETDFACGNHVSAIREYCSICDRYFEVLRMCGG